MTLDSLPTAPALPAEGSGDAAWPGSSGALDRFRRSFVRTVLGPVIRPLAPGERVALFVTTGPGTTSRAR